LPNCHNNTWRNNNNKNNKSNKEKKRQIEETSIEVDEQEFNNNENERKLPATIHNSNQEEDDDNNNYEDDNDNDDDSPRCSLPNCTHNDLDVPSRKRNQTPIGNETNGEIAKLQATEHLISPNNLILSHCNDYCKYDYHKYDADLPVYKLDPFTTGAYVHKCVNKKLFPHCKFFWNNQDIDLFMALVFDKIGMDGFRPEDKYKQMTSWVAIRQMIEKDI